MWKIAFSFIDNSSYLFSFKQDGEVLVFCAVGGQNVVAIFGLEFEGFKIVSLDVVVHHHAGGYKITQRKQKLTSSVISCFLFLNIQIFDLVHDTL